MLTRIRLRPAIDLARQDLPAPLDVINLVHTERFASYRWYALLVYPAMTLVGARALWMGRLERSLHGEVQADKLLVVRYPSQRRFLAMTLNPYYLAINRLREAGVRRFQASFTHASHTAEGFGRRRLLVAVHFSSPPGEDALPAVTELLSPVAGELVYATRAVASLGFLDPPVPTDPQPLALRQLALFAAPDGDLPEAELTALSGPLAAITDGVALQVYRREPASAYRPSFRRAPRAAAAQATAGS
jgi:uncharacterized protein (DUF1330 family)